MQKINSIEKLKRESFYNDKKGMADFFILLNGGLRSSKRIVYYPDSNTFDIHNEIDDSYQEDLAEEELMSETNIVIAIEQGAPFRYEV